jgi:serine/threonine protein kinase
MEDDDLENTCLVYELATNGSLDKFWENDLGRSRLSDEKMRIRIALEVATALRYMHEGLDGGDACYHRDIKSGNICLAADLSARIIDCGLSKYVTESDGSVSTAGRSGTPGE